jgi:hypothetical protein
MQYRYGAGGVGSFFDAAVLLFLAFAIGGTTSSAAASSSSCFGGSGSTARNLRISNEYLLYVTICSELSVHLLIIFICGCGDFFEFENAFNDSGFSVMITKLISMFFDSIEKYHK